MPTDSALYEPEDEEFVDGMCRAVPLDRSDKAEDSASSLVFGRGK